MLPPKEESARGAPSAGPCGERRERRACRERATSRKACWRPWRSSLTRAEGRSIPFRSRRSISVPTFPLGKSYCFPQFGGQTSSRFFCFFSDRPSRHPTYLNEAGGSPPDDWFKYFPLEGEEVMPEEAM